MEVDGIWSNEIPSQLEHVDEVYNKIEEVLEMFDISNEYDTKYYINSTTFYEEKIGDVMFTDWLYDFSKPDLKDVKKELSIKLGKATDIDLDVYANMKETLEDRTLTDKSFLVSINKQNDMCVWNKEDYFEIKRNFLLMIDNKNQFMDNVGECFSNIYFDSNVKSSINSLNNQFVNIKGEIINHLRMLNNYSSSFVDHRNAGDDNRKICSAFKAFASIECSPQAGRENTKDLTKKFYSEIEDKEIEICCELHTKFSNFNRNREKQDRIYFHPGFPGVKGGKVIVIHIGDHI